MSCLVCCMLYICYIRMICLCTLHSTFTLYLLYSILTLLCCIVLYSAHIHITHMSAVFSSSNVLQLSGDLPNLSPYCSCQDACQKHQDHQAQTGALAAPSQATLDSVCHSVGCEGEVLRKQLDWGCSQGPDDSKLKHLRIYNTAWVWKHKQ